jgi:hypothetical protein
MCLEVALGPLRNTSSVSAVQHERKMLRDVEADWDTAALEINCKAYQLVHHIY